jgi:serine protease AprX
MLKELKFLNVLLILALLATLAGSFGFNASATQAKAHPLLVQIAEQAPEKLVSVIVQKASQGPQAEALAVKLGGVVTKDLRIIHAFSARMSARDAMALAKSPGVRWVSPDASVVKTGRKSPGTSPGGGTTTTSTGAEASTLCAGCIGTTALINTYNRTVGADRLWNEAPYLQGQGITVAVLDTGLSANTDLNGRVLVSQSFNSQTLSALDTYGHGSHVAGIIGGNGTNSGGAYTGMAPKVNLINLRVSDEYGNGSSSDVVAALQWVYDHHQAYNIRVVNISFNSSLPESYHTNPICAAAEILWFNGVVVVVSGGNLGKNDLYPPANDPFVITVGASDDLGTADPADDVLAKFSAYGATQDGFSKPDLVAPGVDLVSTLTNPFSKLAVEHPENVVYVGSQPDYFRMSGTSMAAPVVSGAAALLLQDEPNLTPDQVKYRLKATARPMHKQTGSGAGLLDVYAAVHSTTTASANTGLTASQLLWSGSEPLAWSSVSWNSVSWNSVSWNSVSWNSVSWNSVSWNSVYWEP